jgi:hypothetical protein
MSLMLPGKFFDGRRKFQKSWGRTVQRRRMDRRGDVAGAGTGLDKPDGAGDHARHHGHAPISASPWAV